MREFIKDGKEYVELTAIERDRCFQMLEGTAQPSDFGYDFIAAALLITMVILALDEVSKAGEVPEEFKVQMADFLARAKDLCRIFGEAGRLSGEDNEDKVA